MDVLACYDGEYTPLDSQSRPALPFQGQWAGIGFPSGYYLGRKMLFRGLDAAAPTQGDFIVGDIVYNTAPSTGGHIGWVCTVAGNPGTWNTFGLIS